MGERSNGKVNKGKVNKGKGKGSSLFWGALLLNPIFQHSSIPTRRHSRDFVWFNLEIERKNPCSST